MTTIDALRETLRAAFEPGVARAEFTRAEAYALLAALDVVEELRGFDLQVGYGAEWKTKAFADAVHMSLAVFDAALADGGAER